MVMIKLMIDLNTDHRKIPACTVSTTRLSDASSEYGVPQESYIHSSTEYCSDVDLTWNPYIRYVHCRYICIDELRCIEFALTYTYNNPSDVNSTLHVCGMQGIQNSSDTRLCVCIFTRVGEQEHYKRLRLALCLARQRQPTSQELLSSPKVCHIPIFHSWCLLIFPPALVSAGDNARQEKTRHV